MLCNTLREFRDYPPPEAFPHNIFYWWFNKFPTKHPPPTGLIVNDDSSMNYNLYKTKPLSQSTRHKQQYPPPFEQVAIPVSSVHCLPLKISAFQPLSLHPHCPPYNTSRIPLQTHHQHGVPPFHTNNTTICPSTAAPQSSSKQSFYCGCFFIFPPRHQVPTTVTPERIETAADCWLVVSWSALLLLLLLLFLLSLDIFLPL